MYATISGQDAAVKMLLEANAAVNLKNPMGQYKNVRRENVTCSSHDQILGCTKPRWLVKQQLAQTLVAVVSRSD